MNHVTLTNGLCHTYEWVVSQIWMCAVYGDAKGAHRFGVGAGECCFAWYNSSNSMSLLNSPYKVTTELSSETECQKFSIVSLLDCLYKMSVELSFENFAQRATCYPAARVIAFKILKCHLTTNLTIWNECKADFWEFPRAEGEVLCSGSCDRRICVWCTRTWQCLHRIEGHVGSVSVYCMTWLVCACDMISMCDTTHRYAWRHV